MRKLLILSALALSAAATGCTGRNPCGDSWRPGYYLFGLGRNQQQTGYNDCCDPCGGNMGTSYGVQSAPVMMNSAPCCQ